MVGMSLKVLSVIISFAMMLTGTYGMEAPEAAARTLTLSNITLTVDGESVTLEPTVTAGVATESGKALYNFAVRSGGSELLPVQLAVTEEALTALVKNGNAAFTVPAEAINALTEQAEAEAMANVSADSKSSAVVEFITKDYLPAYTKVLQKAMDPEFTKTINEKAQALWDERIDRGEGTANVLDVDGTEYDCTVYEYTLEGEELMALADGVYALDEDLNALYQAIFKLYGMMPEESGLNGVTSLQELVEKTGLQMTAEIEESVGVDSDLRYTEATLSLDLAAMVNERVAIPAESEQEAPEVTAEDVPPLEFVITSLEVDGGRYSSFSTEYGIQDVEMSMEMFATQDDEGMTMDLDVDLDAGEQGGMAFSFSADESGNDRSAELSVDFSSNGQSVEMSGSYESQLDPATGDRNVTADVAVDALDVANARFEFSAEGVTHADGTSHFAIVNQLDNSASSASLAFDADVTADAIEDATEGVEALVIDDLQKAGDIMSGEEAQGKVMQAAGSVMSDASALTGEESVARAAQLLSGFMAAQADAPDREYDGEPEDDDYEYDEEDYEEPEDDDYEYEYGEEDYEEPEDDGVLPYDMPEFTFIPEGWAPGDTTVDTAYDMVMMDFATEDYSDSMFATFMVGDDETEYYALDAEGKLVPGDARNTRVEKMDDAWSVNMNSNGVSVSLYIAGEDVDADTVAQIINGLRF